MELGFSPCCCYFYRVMIIDLDAHQGNGHELDFANDSMVTYFSSWWLSFTFLWNIDDRIFINRTSLYTGYVQSWHISICKLPSVNFTRVFRSNLCFLSITSFKILISFVYFMVPATLLEHCLVDVQG